MDPKTFGLVFATGLSFLALAMTTPKPILTIIYGVLTVATVGVLVWGVWDSFRARERAW